MQRFRVADYPLSQAQCLCADDPNRLATRPIVALGREKESAYRPVHKADGDFARDLSAK